MSRAIEVGEPDWKPLEGVLSQELCEEFMFMCAISGIVLYKHRDTSPTLRSARRSSVLSEPTLVNT
jgi:hypothetical protein